MRSKSLTARPALIAAIRPLRVSPQILKPELAFLPVAHSHRPLTSLVLMSPPGFSVSVWADSEAISEPRKITLEEESRYSKKGGMFRNACTLQPRNLSPRSLSVRL